MSNDASNLKIQKSLHVTEHLANERTFLAWIRTSIGIMAFGFVVQKFAIFIKEFSLLILKSALPFHVAGHPRLEEEAGNFGTFLLAFGVIIALLAFIQYRKIEKQLENESYQPTIWLNALLAICIVSIGIVLGVYLNVSFY